MVAATQVKGAYGSYDRCYWNNQESNFVVKVVPRTCLDWPDFMKTDLVFAPLVAAAAY